MASSANFDAENAPKSASGRDQTTSASQNSQEPMETAHGSASEVKIATDEDLVYPPGTSVVVKIQGYPWWPAVVVTPEHFPAQALAARPTTKIRKDGSSSIAYPVQFLGTPEYYWSKATDLKHLSTEDAENWINSGKKTNPKGLKAAYQQALKLPTLDELMSFKGQIESGLANEQEIADLSDGERDENDPELDDEGKPIKKKKRSNGRTPRSNAIKMTSKKRKLDAVEKDSTTKIAKAERNKSADLLAVLQKPPSSPELSPEESRKRAWANKVKTVMYLRHKLQKTLLGNEEPKAVDLDEVPAHLNKLDDVQVDVDIFRETKIGKVLLRINKLEHIPRDETLGIKDHVNKLLSKWQKIMTDASKKSTDETEVNAESPALPCKREELADDKVAHNGLEKTSYETSVEQIDSK